MKNIAKQQKINDHISNIDHQMSGILGRQDQHHQYIQIQRLEIINSYIFEEDNYGNKYFSPKNGDKQKRLYAKEVEEIRRINWYENFRKSLYEEPRQEFDRKDRESSEQQLRKEREQQEQQEQRYEQERREQRYEQERREQDHMAFLRRQKLEKQQKNEPKKPEQDNDNDYTPW